MVLSMHACFFHKTEELSTNKRSQKRKKLYRWDHSLNAALTEPTRDYLRALRDNECTFKAGKKIKGTSFYE